jgi:hypothetical protein
MNATQVLKKIVSMMAREEAKMTYAKLADGTIVESPTFDVGEPVEIVSEDGKSPAPDGEHELMLRDTEGNEVRIKVFTKDGIITERENVELEKDEEEEKLESIAGEDIGGESATSTTDEVQKIPQDMEKKFEEFAYRIEELEKRLQQMEDVKEDLIDSVKKAETVETKPLTEEMSKDLPKLDGAPVEEGVKLQNIKLGKNKAKVANAQSQFLSKLYN